MHSQVDVDVRQRGGCGLHLDLVHAFDTPRPELALLGWSCLSDRTVADELWLECDGARFPCLTGLPRFDVARSNGTPSLNHAGFLGRLPLYHNPSAVTMIASRSGLGQIVVPRPRHRTVLRHYQATGLQRLTDVVTEGAGVETVAQRGEWDT